MKKILVFGFPHCGTSILKSIIGHCPDVQEIKSEISELNHNSEKAFLLGKWPFTEERFFGSDYAEYEKIFILRNPLWVFSSLNRRFGFEKIPELHCIDDYERSARRFHSCIVNPRPDIHTILYEDLFEANYSAITKIIDSIGISWDYSIFSNEKKDNQIAPEIVRTCPTDTPDQKDHLMFRTWQINQEFVNMNDPNKIQLSEQQELRIRSSEIINNLYQLSAIQE